MDSLEAELTALLRNHGASNTQAKIAFDLITGSVEEANLRNFKAPSNGIVYLNSSKNGEVVASQLSSKNLSISLEKLFMLSSMGAFTIASTLADKWLLPFAAVTFILHGKSEATKKLSYLAGYIVDVIYTSEINLSKVEVCDNVLKTIQAVPSRNASAAQIDKEIEILKEEGVLIQSPSGLRVAERVVIRR